VLGPSKTPPALPTEEIKGKGSARFSRHESTIPDRNRATIEAAIHFKGEGGRPEGG